MGSPRSGFNSIRSHGDGIQPKPASPRLWSLCREVAMCSDQMESLQREMGDLRDELRGRDDFREFVEKGDAAEADVIEGELQLAEYRLTQLVNEKSKFSPARGPKKGREDLALKSKPARGVPLRVLDQHRELDEYLPVRRTPSPVKQGGMDGEMPKRLRELGDAIGRRDAEIAALREEVLGAGASSSKASAEELKTLAKENDILANRACEATERVAALTRANSALEKEIENGDRKTKELQVERKALLKRLGELEKAADLAEENTQQDLKDVLLNSEQQIRELENANAALERNVKDSELREANFLQALKRTEAERKTEEVDMAAQIQKARSSTDQAERRASELEQSLSEMRLRFRSEEELGSQCNRALKAEVTEIRNAVAHAESNEKAVEAELNESRRRESETERKAMDVARELFETSQSLAWLREEVAMQRGLRSELGEERQNSQILRKKVEALQVEATMHGTPDSSHIGGSSAAEMELKELREGQVRAVSEALHCAWEAEARERRNVEQQLEALRARWQPLKRQLVRLCSNASRWHEALCSYGEPQSPMPPLPSGMVWDDENEASEATEQLRAFLEALAEESMRRVADSRSRVTELELLQQELSDRAVASIMRKKDKVDHLKVEKHDLLKQIHNLGVHQGDHGDYDQVRVNSAPSTPPRAFSPSAFGTKNDAYAVDRLNQSTDGVKVGGNSAAYLSALPVNSSTEQMYEHWDDQGRDRIQHMQHQINQLQRESFRPKPDLRSQRSTPALRGAAGRHEGSANRRPLYRIEDAPRRHVPSAAERHTHSFQPGQRARSTQRRSPNASFQASERFDADSIHYPFPGRGVG
eukprot:gnl/MRDRNA2_/MRDRNA2_112508_c0_seq1.p1 gnl/MRDRNA2_/MRDRNA2_112508_c0~~gnl/MRDRNA2_/MRDRNA2_112508_c0_seq1.p1  ORF type:complete len:827 (+),score=189.47 gnl/MRDRNA2_/MRDRNA2_112508_c0_seq1:60-2540(+)